MKIWHISAVSLLVTASLTIGLPVLAETKDTIEKRLDESRDVGKSVAKDESKGRWVLVPIPVSNPTIGSGVEAALLYLHPKKEGQESSPNATSGIGAMYTDTGSWLVGGFHDDSWQNDRYRFTGFIGYGEIALKYYGGGDIPLLPSPLSYDLNIFVAMPQLQIRIPGTRKWYAGVSYLYMNSESTFHLSDILALLPDAQQRFISAGLGPVATYDSRNNNYYPTQGQYFQVKMMHFSERWGSDQNYQKTNARLSHYQPILERTVLALSSRLESSSDDTPFFDLPYLNLRGFNRGRYQDFNTLSLHAEVRYQFRFRWGVVGFTETGWHADSLHNLNDNPRVTSYGTGLRWRTTKDKPLNLGVDVAFTDEDTVLYIQVGERF